MNINELRMKYFKGVNNYHIPILMILYNNCKRYKVVN